MNHDGCWHGLSQHSLPQIPSLPLPTPPPSPPQTPRSLLSPLKPLGLILPADMSLVYVKPLHGTGHGIDTSHSNVSTQISHHFHSWCAVMLSSNLTKDQNYAEGESKCMHQNCCGLGLNLLPQQRHQISEGDHLFATDHFISPSVRHSENPNQLSTHVLPLNFYHEGSYIMEIQQV